MKQAKRVVSLILILIMVASMFTGCKKEEKKANNGARKLTVGIPQDSTVPDYNTNAFCVYLEEKTGIDLEWVYYANAASSYTQQLTLQCTSDDPLPDVLLGFDGMGHYTVNQFGEDGYIRDLTDLIKKYAPNFNEKMESYDKEYADFVWQKGTNTNTGAFYAMPNTQEDVFMDSLQSIVWINKNWLGKVGKNIPTTVDELYDVLVAFKNAGDLNGNGKKDEIPMIGNGLDLFITNAFIEMYGIDWNVKNGKLWDPYATDEYRESLIFMNKLVKEGLMNKLSFTISTTEMKQLVSPVGEASKVGVWSGHYSLVNASGNHLEEFVALPSLADKTGKGGYTMWRREEVDWAGMITKDCDNPELAMEFLDVFYLDETVSRMRWGEKGVDWVEEAGKDWHGDDAYIKVINPNAFHDRSQNKTVGFWLSGTSHYNFSTILQPAEGRTSYAVEGDRLYQEQWEVLENGEVPEEQLGELIYTTEEYDKREEKAGTLSSYMSEQKILFISGESDPSDNEQWTKFQQTMKQLGRDELKEVAQSAYTRKNK